MGGAFRVGIYKLDSKPHAACFENFAEALVDAFGQLGHKASYCGPDIKAGGGRLVLLGATDALSPSSQLPPDTIIFNAEQVAVTGVAARMPDFVDYRKFTVWDYAASNVAALREQGIAAIHCPVGYARAMRRSGSLPQDVDVLFYGDLNPRRRQLLDSLRLAGVSVDCLSKAYGEALDQAIQRSKIVLNVHFYQPAIFEIFRCSHLFANSKCVVSEGGGVDPGLEALASRAAVVAPYDRIVSVCQQYLADDGLRRSAEDRAFAEFSKTSLADSVEQALALERQGDRL